MICIPIKTTSSAVQNRSASWIVFLEFYTFCWPKSLKYLMKSNIYQVERLDFLIKQRVARKLRSIDFLKLNYLCIMETIPYNTWVLNQWTRHVSASFVSAQTVMGPAILRATRIYRRRSVMVKQRVGKTSRSKIQVTFHRSEFRSSCDRNEQCQKCLLALRFRLRGKYFTL